MVTTVPPQLCQSVMDDKQLKKRDKLAKFFQQMYNVQILNVYASWNNKMPTICFAHMLTLSDLLWELQPWKKALISPTGAED